MQFINAKQAYPLILGMIIALAGVALWQKVNPYPVREIPTSSPVVIPPLPSPLPRPTTAAGTQQGALRVGNRTDRPVRIVLLSRRDKESTWENAEPVNWDFSPGEGGTEGLPLSLLGKDNTSYEVKIRKGDIIVAFATDGSRAYWGPNVVGETDAPFWDNKRREWSMVLQP